MFALTVVLGYIYIYIYIHIYVYIYEREREGGCNVTFPMKLQEL